MSISYRYRLYYLGTACPVIVQQFKTSTRELRYAEDELEAENIPILLKNSFLQLTPISNIAIWIHWPLVIIRFIQLTLVNGGDAMIVLYSLATPIVI